MVFLNYVLHNGRMKSIFNYQKQHCSHLPYVYVIIRDIWSLRVSPLFLTFSQATGKESRKVAPLTFFPPAGASSSAIVFTTRNKKAVVSINFNVVSDKFIC